MNNNARHSCYSLNKLNGLILFFLIIVLMGGMIALQMNRQTITSHSFNE